MTDESTANAIAKEMVRVVKSGGYLMLTDWRYNFRREGYAGLSRARIDRLFGVGRGDLCDLHEARGTGATYRKGVVAVLPCYVHFPVCAVLPFFGGAEDDNGLEEELVIVT